MEKPKTITCTPTTLGGKGYKKSLYVQILLDTSKRQHARSYLSGLESLNLCGPLLEPLSLSKFSFLPKDFSAVGENGEKKYKDHQSYKKPAVPASSTYFE